MTLQKKPIYTPFLNLNEEFLMANTQHKANHPKKKPQQNPNTESRNVPCLCIAWACDPSRGKRLCLKRWARSYCLDILLSSNSANPFSKSGIGLARFSDSANLLIVCIVPRYSLYSSISLSLLFSILVLIDYMFLLSAGLKCVPRKFKSISAKSYYFKMLLFYDGAELLFSKL